MNITLQTPEQFARAPSPQLERRRVPAMGMLALPLFCGDEVEIVDPQGLQPALVAGFGAEGESRTAALGLAENANGGGARIAACPPGGAPRAARLAKKMREHRIDLAAAKTRELTGGDTRAGSTDSFFRQTDPLGLICA
ncbi:MAG: hypothetical protein MPK10_03655, partial [Gammaproteobacteria bacterium]|nr:hypothetical protein [Gammaproteobacteria bacterium]